MLDTFPPFLSQVGYTRKGWGLRFPALLLPEEAAGSAWERAVVDELRLQLSDSDFFHLVFSVAPQLVLTRESSPNARSWDARAGGCSGR